MHAAATSSESARINLRTSPDVKELVEWAAAMTGSIVSSFMLQSSSDVARQVLAQQEILILSDQHAFLNAMDISAPPKRRVGLPSKPASSCAC